VHEAAAAVGADQIARPYRHVAVQHGDPRADAILLILLKAGQRMTVARRVAQFHQPLAQYPFRQMLRQHQRFAVRFGDARRSRLHRRHVLMVSSCRPEPDVALMADMSMPLERVLLPLLVRIDRRGPIGVVEPADLVGRDYTTVSRQVARLDKLGLVVRRSGARDKRVREAEVTELGREIADAIDRMREQLVGELMADWTNAERRDLARLMKRFANDMNEWVPRRRGEDADE
jgi:DNA-binding MarR family transcriptional regulator